MKFIGTLFSGDFEENTMTFKIDGKMTLRAGKYLITEIDDAELKNLPSVEARTLVPNEGKEKDFTNCIIRESCSSRNTAKCNKRCTMYL